MTPTWLNALRILEYTVLGIASVTLIRGIARMVRLTVYSQSLNSRILLMMAAFGQLLFLIQTFTASVSVTERIERSEAFNWRDWTTPLVYSLIILFALLVHRTEPRWNVQIPEETGSPDMGDDK